MLLPTWPLLTICMMLTCHAVSESHQDEVQSNTNQNININNQQETIKSGNTKTNNFNLHESNYQPTQSTQLVFNVAKYKPSSANKLRRSRPPTIDEFEIKKRIMDVYSYALEDLPAVQRESVYLEHLGRILRALNPKYISTRRVANVAFADPHDRHLGQVGAPEDELPEPIERIASEQDHDVAASHHGREQLVLRGDSELSLQKQLDMMSERVKETAVWDRDFVRKLFQVPDADFTPTQLAYKRLLQCITYPLFCKQQMIVKKKEDQQEEDEIESQNASSELDQMAAASEVQPRVVMTYPPKPEEPRGQQPPQQDYRPYPPPPRQPQQQQQQQHQQPQPQPQYPYQAVPEWRNQQPPPVLQQPPVQAQYQPIWHKRTGQPQQQQQQQQQQKPPPSRYVEQQQVNYKVANPDIDLPQKLVQRYAPEFQEQMRRISRLRGGHYRHHK